MSPFEFVCAFYSVVLGVAVAQLLTGVGRLIEVRDQVRTYWVHSLWVVIILLADVNSWLVMWEMRSKSWRVPSFLLLVALLASIYLITVLLFPRLPESGDRIDLGAHYYKNRRIFFLATAAAWMLALLCNLSVLSMKSWLNAGVVVPLLSVLLSILAARTGNRRYHAVFAVFILAMSLLSLFADPTPIQ
jgi:hypothetical protein